MLQKLIEERASLWAQMCAIMDGAGTRALNADEDGAYTRMETRMGELEREIARAEAHETRRAALTEPRRDVELITGPAGAQGAEVDTEARATEYREAFYAFVRYGAAELTAEQRTVLQQGRFEARDMTRGVNAQGGFTVPTGFYDRLVEHLVENGAVRQTRATVLATTAGHDLPVPKTTAHGAATWIGETGPVAFSDETFGQVTLGAHMSARGIKLSIVLLQDSAIDIEAYLLQELGRSLGALHNAGYVNGDGAAKPTGILQSSTLGKTGAAGQVTTVTTDDLFDLYYAVAPSYRRSGEWLVSDLMSKTIRKLKDSTGQYLWAPGLTAGEPTTLLGKPVVSDPDMPVPAASAKSIAFGDLSRYFIRDVRDVALVRLNERYMDALEIGFIAFMRTEGKLIDTTGAIKHYAHPAA